MVNKKEAFLLGEKLKRIRTDQGLSLEELAQRTNLTRSFLSQVEKNKTSPSINSLISIAHALRVNVGDLFREQENVEQYILHQEHRESFSVDRNKLTIELLAPRTQNKKFDPMFMRFGVGGDTGTIKLSGAFFMVILEGKLELWVGNKVHILSQGDSIYLDNSPETRGTNIGDTDVLAYAVASTPIV